MIYYLKRDFYWQPIKSIFITTIESIIFFSRCLTKEELRYRSLELEVVYLVWVYKRLCILLYFNNHRIMVLTDYKIIRRIVHYNILNIISIDRVNRRFINVSVYLLVYLLEIYHMFGRFNYISDVLLCFCIINNDIVCKSIVKSILNTF